MACAPPAEGEGTRFETDPDGVVTATAERPAWRDGQHWSFDSVPTLTLGSVDGPPETLFADVVAAARLSDGRVAVADAGHGEIRVFLQDGRWQKTLGGVGEGPGEFVRLAWMGTSTGDTIIAFDSGLRRFQFFAPDAGMVRTLSLETTAEAVPDKVVGLIDPTTVVMRFLEFGDRVPAGIVRWPAEELVGVDLIQGRLKSIVSVSGTEASVEPRPGGGYRHGAVRFGKGFEFAAGETRAVVMPTDSFRLHVLDANGTVSRRLARAGLEGGPETTEADVNAHIDGTIARVYPDVEAVDPEALAAFRRRQRAIPTAPTLPLNRSVQVDAEGNIWVEPFFRLGDPPTPHLVFAPDGTWLGEVSMPSGLDRGYIAYQAPYLEIGSDYLLGVWRGDLDVPEVRLYPLLKPHR